ncbi:Methylamine utilisation protein MauE [Saccharopolyspora shandongensis]|uniref:Methylamine utilisation protein MauE n=1 Tax=Saccharopolyspora shandongensis TaxID=418495 RepID=A0A1H3RMF2_9PSEU|nr:MauE/DoxX family redox-associated membrane protein [Saccharopolyspora shandongensis]SDZ26912.1 Methylamine utilisation protein MauE [Saccharopolyspora shandongensis]
MHWFGSAALAVCGVLAFAAIGKLRSVGGFARSIAGYRIFPDRLAPVLARVVIAAELLSAVLLLLPPLRLWGAVLAAGLFAAFLIGMISVLRRGMRVDCGCFQAGEAIGVGSVARTALLFVLAVLACLAGDAPVGPVHVLVGAVLVAAVFGLSGLLKAPSPGPARGAVLAIGADVAAFADGGDRVLFAYISPLCGHCRLMLPEFGAAARKLPVVLLSNGAPDEVRDYLDRQGVSLPLVTGPDVFDANNVPGPPYAVVTTGSGVVLAQGGANRPEQLASLLAEAGN